MKFFRVVKLPEGVAPAWVRHAWIGIELPINESVTDEDLRRVATIAKTWGVDWSPNGAFAVTTIAGIAALRQRHPRAADWWAEWFVQNPLNTWIAFQADECEMVA